MLTLDNTAELETVRQSLPPVCLQGAFDPSLLVSGTADEVRDD